MTAEALLAAGVATLREAAGQRGLWRGLRVLAGGAFAGEATTVRLPAGDNLGIHASHAHARAPSVLWVASGAGGTYGVLGEFIALAAPVAGLTGVVIDSVVGDADGVLVAPHGRLVEVLADAVERGTKEGGIGSRLADVATTVEVLGLAGLIEGGERR